MNLSELVRHVAEETGMTRSTAGAPVKSVLSGIAGSPAGGEADSLPGFGTFAAGSRPARTGRNPGTGESLEISLSTVATFKAGKPLQDAVNAGGA